MGLGWGWAKGVQAKETIWSEFSSQELLDYCLANRQKSEKFSDQYYLVKEEQSGDSNCDSSEWENESNCSSDSDNGRSELNREAAKCRFHPDYAGDDPIKQRLQVLSFKDHKFSTGKWCLFCLEKGHQFFKCKSYSGELHDKLHLIDNQPCGYHTHEVCIHHDGSRLIISLGKNNYKKRNSIGEGFKKNKIWDFP